MRWSSSLTAPKSQGVVESDTQPTNSQPNTLLFFINVSYSHENLEQHAIAHVYPELEAKYIEDEKTKCKAVIIKNSRCNTRDDL